MIINTMNFIPLIYCGSTPAVKIFNPSQFVLVINLILHRNTILHYFVNISAAAIKSWPWCYFPSCSLDAQLVISYKFEFFFLSVQQRL